MTEQQTPLTQVNADGAVVKVVSVASNGEQIAAAFIGLLTAGPLGAAAAWGAIRMFAGKWTPWMISGCVAIIPLWVVQAAVISGFSASTSAPVEEVRTID